MHCCCCTPGAISKKKKKEIGSNISCVIRCRDPVKQGDSSFSIRYIIPERRRKQATLLCIV